MPRRQTTEKAAAEVEVDRDEQPAQPSASSINNLKIRLLPGHSEDLTAVTFQIQDEDHTLGNALRYIIMKNPDVEFCGYSIPHPSEPKMNLRIQTYGDDGKTAVDALEKGLDDLMALCDVVENKFQVALEEKQDRMETD